MTQPITQPGDHDDGRAASAPPAPDGADSQPERALTPSAVVLRADQSEFNERQVSALALINPGLQNASRPQLAMFFHHCVRSGLDPFARQIYMIGRKNRGPDREDNPVNWTIQTGIDGFRTIAHRAAERTGERISYEDTVYYDPDGGAHDVWLAAVPPAAVKVTVLRGTSRFPLIARWSEFAPMVFDAKQGTYVLAKMWRQMPAHMLRKCAEAGALRMAAPQDLSGVYVEEEMAQADAEVVAGQAEEAAQRLRAAAGLESDEDGQSLDQPAAETVPPKKQTTPRKRAQARPEAAEQGTNAADDMTATLRPRSARKRTAAKKTAAEPTS
ncbi:phage recombination protein Bet [Streptomyces sp. NPDC001233]|uniref:phage recombination protein Bet n=1 Tax=Streptomyces sp. NPDC002589 TaxID=3154420 RepID=UPI003322E7F0